MEQTIVAKEEGLSTKCQYVQFKKNLAYYGR